MRKKKFHSQVKEFRQPLGSVEEGVNLVLEEKCNNWKSDMLGNILKRMCLN